MDKEKRKISRRLWEEKNKSYRTRYKSEWDRANRKFRTLNRTEAEIILKYLPVNEDTKKLIEKLRKIIK